MFIINGEINNQLPVQDRGLHYGDGVFETIAVLEQEPLNWETHYQRLKTGCERLGFQCPSSSVLQSEAAGLLEKKSHLAVLKLIVTRGQAGRGYRPAVPDSSPTRILGLYPWPEYPDQNYTHGVFIRICQTRLGHNPALAGIKHLNRLEQVLARSEWNQAEIAEGLMLDTDANVISGTMSNLFMIHNDTLVTPDISQCGVNGIIRQKILALAPETGLKVNITTIKESDLHQAEELFLCNSLIGIWTVKMLGDREYNAGLQSQAIRNKLLERKIIAR